MDRTSFYGGIPGQSFEIKRIFKSKKEMEADLQQRWQSTIGVSDFVIISYGLPNDYDYYYIDGLGNKTYVDQSVVQPEPDGTFSITISGTKYIVTRVSAFQNRENEDKAAFGQTYNSTLWQKIYTENNQNQIDALTGIETFYVSGNYGLGYKLIASMSGKTPTLVFKHDVLDADQLPYITVDNSSVDNPIITLHLPQSQVLQVSSGVLDADQLPYVNYDDQGNRINRPLLDIQIPQSQILQNAVTHILNADQNPSVDIITSNITSPVVINTNINEPVPLFYLPQSQVMQDPTTQVVAPLDPPDVDINNTNINRPFLEFKLPRAIKFYYGNLVDLGNKANATSSDPSVANYAPGDYYIHENTGFIYQVVANNAGTVDFQYVACIQMPAPGVSTNPINPYTTGGASQVMPSVTPSYDNPVQQLGYRLNFNLPKLPTFSVSSPPIFVGSAQPGAATLTPNSETNVNLQLTLPSATRMFAGNEVAGASSSDVLNAIVTPDPIIGSPLPGDLYLNTDTGTVYKLDNNGVWKFQNDGLKGPVGDSLNIVRDYTLTVGSDYPADNLLNGVNYIINNYVDSGGNPLPYSPDELFAITWIDNGIETSYWYYYTGSTAQGQYPWGRVQISGGFSDLIKNSYTNSPPANPIINKTYSIDYINKLIGGNISASDPNKTTFSKAQIQALLSVNTFQEAESGSWWPV